MKKLILLLIVPIFISISNVSAENTASGTNFSPIAVNDTAITNEDTSVTIDLISNDTDANLDILKVTSISSVLNWTWTITSSWTWVIFTPNLNFNWTWSFNYVVSDWSLTDTWSVTVKVNPVNDKPSVVDDKLITNINTQKTIDTRVNDTDTDWDILHITWVTNWWHWTVTFTSVSVTYKPNLDYEWNDSFTYTISDWSWLTDTWKVAVIVKKADNWDNGGDEDDNWNKYVVKTVQKEFISKFKSLKSQYKYLMWDNESRNEYLSLKKDLRSEYLLKLKEVTGQGKKYSYQWETIKAQYKNIYRNKYWYKISVLSESELSTLIWKIDNMISEVNTWNYSNETKTKFNTMLLALRELVLEYTDNVENTLDIDSLFE